MTTKQASSLARTDTYGRNGKACRPAPASALRGGAACMAGYGLWSVFLPRRTGWRQSGLLRMHDDRSPHVCWACMGTSARGGSGVRPRGRPRACMHAAAAAAPSSDGEVPQLSAALVFGTPASRCAGLPVHACYTHRSFHASCSCCGGGQLRVYILITPAFESK